MNNLIPDYDLDYDSAIDNFLTGDIHLIPTGFLFSCIEKFWLNSLEDCDIRDVQSRRDKMTKPVKFLAF